MSTMIHVRLHYYYLSLKMRPLQSLKLDPTGLRQHILLKAPNYSIPAKGCSKGHISRRRSCDKSRAPWVSMGLAARSGRK